MTAAAPESIADIADLLQHALVIETEAAERYRSLGHQMAVHNSPHIARIFEKMADIEGRHAAEIEARLRGLSPPDRKPWEYAWGDAASPEAGGDEEAHYMMTARQALEMVLEAEQRAYDFYRGLAKTVRDREIKALVDEFATEEKEHVALVENLLAKEPYTPADWDFDPDPPGQGD